MLSTDKKHRAKIYKRFFCRRKRKLFNVMVAVSMSGMLALMVCACNPLVGYVYADDSSAVARTTTVNPRAALSISGSLNQTTPVDLGSGAAYRSHIVNVVASDIMDYDLRISYGEGETALVGDAENATIIGGAADKIGAEMEDNTWGYGWGDTQSSDDQLIYHMLPVEGNGAMLVGDNVSKNAVNFARKLAFAAKFAPDAVPGHYKANVVLSLVVTPKEVVSGFGSINYMQEMTPTVCDSIVVGTTGELEDTRNGKVYTVAKLQNKRGNDANCWMTQNLAIDLDEEGILSPADSDVTKNWPNEPVIPLMSGNYPEVSTQIQYSPNALGGEGYEPIMGYYYSWCAATAGSCTEAFQTMTNAKESICPRGWALPSGGNGDVNQYYTLIDGMTIEELLAAPYNFVYAGYLNVLGWESSNIITAWMSTPGDSTHLAFRLGMLSGIFVYDANESYAGLSVRCVAR